MSLLTLQDLGLRPSQRRAVEKRAVQEGKTPEEFVRAAVEHALLVGDSFEEVLRPIRAGFRKSGVTENELDALVSRARLEIHAASKRKARK